MTTAKVVETSVTVNNNSPIQDYVHPDDQTQPTFEMTPGSKPFIEDITRWRKDMNFIFEWQNNILRTSATSELNIVFGTRKLNSYLQAAV